MNKHIEAIHKSLDRLEKEQSKYDDNYKNLHKLFTEAQVTIERREETLRTVYYKLCKLVDTPPTEHSDYQHVLTFLTDYIQTTEKIGPHG